VFFIKKRKEKQIDFIIIPMKRISYIYLSSITYKMQCCKIHLFLQDALHVSGGSSAHHQELKSVHTASGIYCYFLLSWWSWDCPSPSTIAKGSSNGLTNTWCCMYSFWTPDDGQRNGLKHVESLAEINEFCNVASFWLYWKNTFVMHRPLNVKFIHTYIHIYICRNFLFYLHLYQKDIHFHCHCCVY
jgi:hypothetical protein